MESNSTTYITLREMWRIFRKNWILIVLISLVAAILVGVLYAAIYSPVYSSRSQYYVSNVSDNTPLYSSGQTTGAMEMAAYCAQFLQGSVVLEKALEAAELTEQECDYIHEQNTYAGHRIGGYPRFEQFDVRDDEPALQKYDTLLLQIVSHTATDEQGRERELIMFGDEGGCQFFIPAEKLRQRDFSDVMYTWDCG